MASTIRTGHLAPVTSPHGSYLNRVESFRDSALRLLRESNLCLRESNAWTPIGRLPPEILSAVFIEAIADVVSAKVTRIRIACVSHHWREVALAIPALWNNLALYTLHCIPEVKWSLERVTASRLLHIRIVQASPYAEQSAAWGPEDAQFLLDEVTRAQSLYIDADPRTCRALRWPQLASSLKRLELRDVNYMHPSHSGMVDRTHELSGLLRTLGTRFRNLQTLMVVEHGVSLDQLRLPNSLVNLYIDNTLPFRRADDWPATFNVLRNLPALERLSLVNAITGFHANTPRDLEPISLPRLRSFSFTGPVYGCLPLVKILKLPRSVRWHLRFSLTKGDAIRVHHELTVELNKVHGHFRSALVGSNPQGMPKLMAWKETQRVEDLDHLEIREENQHVDLVLDHPGLLPRYSNTLRLDSLLSHVRALVLSRPLSRIFQPSLHAQLDELEELSCVFERRSENETDRHFFQRLKECNPPFSSAASPTAPLVFICVLRYPLGVLPAAR